jgi:hypothetical protein
MPPSPLTRHVTPLQLQSFNFNPTIFTAHKPNMSLEALHTSCLQSFQSAHALVTTTITGHRKNGDVHCRSAQRILHILPQVGKAGKAGIGTLFAARDAVINISQVSGRSHHLLLPLMPFYSGCALQLRRSVGVGRNCRVSMACRYNNTIVNSVWYISASGEHLFLLLDLRKNKHWREEAETYPPGSTVLAITVLMVFL